MTDSGHGDALSNLLHEVYAAELRVHAVRLIWLGHRRLKIATLCKAEEDDITGELVRAMKLVVQDPSSPDWVDHYAIREQSPQNVGGKWGKRRPRMDIEVERHQRGPRPCLGFEAKRLGRGKAIGGYLGSEGPGAFLGGHYPTTHGEAGMLGYVQEKTSDEWSAKLGQELSVNSSQHRIAQGGELQALNVEVAMPAFCSGHTDTAGKLLLMIHVLLVFAI
jgi:hypothetical protein